MHLSRPLLAALFTALTVSCALAQNNVGPLVLDPAFANGGKSEIDFGADSAVTTCYIAYKALPKQFNRIVVAGDVYSGNEIHLGFAEYDSSGVLEPTFGTNGVSNLRWSGVDYVTAAVLMPDSSILAVGADAVGEVDNITASLFKLTPNGIPDSTFGPTGLLRSDIRGGFESVDTFRIGTGDTSLRILATGAGTSWSPPVVGGFCAAQFRADGSVDSSFGVGGRSIISPQGGLFAARGFRVSGGEIMFGGLAQEGAWDGIVLGKLHANGIPDSTFGPYGVLNSSIIMDKGTVSTEFSCLYDPDSSTQLNLHPGLLVCAPVSGNLPFTVLKFKLDGTLDSTFGVNGFATAPIISNMSARGLNLSNDGSILVSGSSGNVSAAAKLFPNGVLDTSFGSHGLAMLDADSGQRANYLIGFVPAPLPPPHPNGSAQRFLGIGASMNAAGAPHFLLARYMPTKYAGVNEPNSTATSLNIFPNPARDILNVNSADAISEITITDALGRSVRSFERPGFAAASSSYVVDLSGLANGVYNCSVRTTAGAASRQFTVIH